jgi:hypothetical protein
VGVDDFGDVNQKFGAALMTTGLAKCRGSISDITLNFEPGHTQLQPFYFWYAVSTIKVL